MADESKPSLKQQSEHVPSTKARLLEWLQGKVTNGVVPKSLVLTKADWIRAPESVLERILETFGSETDLIVRSSARAEDQKGNSLAGKYSSVPNLREREGVVAAIDTLFASYESEGTDDLVLVQPMVRGATTVGVAFTADPGTGSPYLVVTYAETADTGAVTSGKAQSATWWAIAEGLATPPSEDLRALLPVLEELQNLLPWPAIDVEFAIVKQLVYVLQARPLSVPRPELQGGHLVHILKRAQRAFDRWNHRHPCLLGRSTVFGVMPDWNPAEIVGIRPRPLALSLYRFLVTDRLWSIQRAAYGYRQISGVPLLVELNGIPFIDVRASINSLIPASLKEEIAERLVDASIELLKERPSLHDKLEFQVVPTCLSADVDVQIAERFGPLLSDVDRSEIVGALRSLTLGLLQAHRKIGEEEATAIGKLNERRERLFALDLNRRELVYWLLTDCAEFGTRPFVGQARRAFIAVELLRSFVRIGVLTSVQYDLFMRGLSTVASRMRRDQALLSEREMTLKYGHLRAGTYDIRSPRYDEDPGVFLRGVTSTSEGWDPSSLEVSTLQELDRFLRDQHLGVDSAEVLLFARRAIEDREEGKFAFTKNLSDAMQALIKLGAEVGIDRDELSYMRIGDLLGSYPSSTSLVAVMRDSIRRGKETFRATREMCVPSLIRDRNELVSFVQADEEPSFFGSEVVVGPVQRLTGTTITRGAVVLLESADPGYDWIFGQEIGAFITMYGGANSHMSIRAHELGVTAVIGAGANLYSRWARARMLRIDPLNRKVEAIP